MKKTLLTILIICLSFLLFSGEHSYKFKSGKFVTKITGPYNSVSTTYFDDYGKKMYVETTSEIPMYGEIQKKQSSILVLPDKSYSIQHDQKSFMEIPDDGEYDMDEDTMDYTDDMGKKIGTEKILGRTCDIYQKDNMKFWIWNEMPLKTEITEQGQKFITEVISIEENAKVPASKFAVPSGYTKQAAPAFNRMGMNMEQLQQAMEAQEAQNSKVQMNAAQDARNKKIKPVSADKFQKAKSAQRIDDKRNKRLKPVSADRFEKKATETSEADKTEEAKKNIEEEQKKKAVEKENDTVDKIKKIRKLKSLF